MPADVLSFSKAERVVEVTQTLDGTILSCSQDSNLLPALLKAGEIDVVEVTLMPQLVGNDQPKLILSSSSRFELQEVARKDDGCVWVRYTLTGD
jgi:hypothetical protein